MKRIIFASMLAIGALFPASSFAQDAKEYNMVITLQNGTTITLGHNDIKNITFNGEEISITGNVVNTIEGNSAEINQLWLQLSQTSELLGQMLKSIKDQYATKPELEEAFLQIEDVNKTMTQIINVLKGDYTSKEETEEIWNVIMGTGGLRDQMFHIYNTIESEIQDVNSSLGNVQNEITELWKDSVSNRDIMQMYVNMLQDQISELNAKIAELESK